MRMPTILKLMLSAAIGSAVFACASTGEQASTSTQSDVLQTQLDDLTRELALLRTAKPEGQLQLMKDYWAMLQRQLIAVRLMPGIERHDCQNWMMVDPRVWGGAQNRPPVSCPTMHDAGPANGWDLPAGMTPRLFTLTMEQQFDTLRAQVETITAETDSDKRLARLRDHYDTRYQDIQTVLGRGWMWAPRNSLALPDPQSPGAEWLGKYCSQCHNAPPPELHTQAEWAHITHKMHAIIQVQSQNEMMGINMPTPDEFDIIVSYLETHAHNG